MATLRGPSLSVPRLTLGTVLILAGLAVEIWQEQDAYTITQLYTFPAFAVEIVGAILVATGVRGWVRASGGPHRTRAAAACGLLGALLWGGVLAWQLGWWSDGDTSALEVYASFVLLFLGVALISVAVSGGVVPSSGEDSAISARGGSDGPGSRRRPIGLAVGILGTGVILLVALALSVGRIELAVTQSDPIYGIFAIELGGSAAWFLYAGSAGVIRVGPPRANVPLRGMSGVAGVALILLAALWWQGSTLYPELAFLLLAMTSLAGGLLLVAAARPSRLRRDARGARRSLVP